jgi:hypothetical protein
LIEHTGSTEAPQVFLVVPEQGFVQKIEARPEDVESYYCDAIIVLNAGVPDAAAVQLRRTLEAAAAQFGIKDQPLVKSIE